MADGVYEIDVSGVEHSASLAAPSTTAPLTLADGSVLSAYARDGSVTSTADGVSFETNSTSGSLRLGVNFDQDNQITLGDLDALKFDFTMTEQNGSPTYSPAFRLVVDADGDLATTGDRGELVFEYAYQGAAQDVDLTVAIEGQKDRSRSRRRRLGSLAAVERSEPRLP